MNTSSLYKTELDARTAFVLTPVGFLKTVMDALRESGDSVGARVNVVAEKVPVGWGEPVYGRLDADIAAAMMGINAVKGVELGAGFRSVTQRLVSAQRPMRARRVAEVGEESHAVRIAGACQ